MTSRPLPPNNMTSDGNTRTTSEKKIEANRKNAKFSTGPTSAEGKKQSSRNSSKHGLLIKDVVITARANKEDQTEFDALLDELRDYYKPIGIVEDLSVRELAVSYWKSARALRCERGDITCAVTDPNQTELSEVEVAMLTLEPAAHAYHSLQRDSRGIKFLLRKAELARDEVKISKSISSELHRWLAPEQKWNGIGKDSLLAALETEIERLVALQKQIEKEGSEWRNDWRDCSAIPSREVLDRINRYETSNVRHRYRVEARLEQLQARRREKSKIGSEGVVAAEIRTRGNFAKRSQTVNPAMNDGTSKATGLYLRSRSTSRLGTDPERGFAKTKPASAAVFKQVICALRPGACTSTKGKWMP